MRKLTEKGSPSFLHIPTSVSVRDALDIGCGDGHWVAHAAQAWGVHGTKIVGIDFLPISKDIMETLSGPSAENTEVFNHNLCVTFYALNSPLILRYSFLA
jgi:SAM-dependent methyltransferase